MHEKNDLSNFSHPKAKPSFKRELELYFRAPENVEDALEVISNMSLFLDLWSSRSGEWNFLQLLAKSADQTIWACVAKCVVTKSGKNLQDVHFDQLGTAGVLQALCVFCQGLMDIEIPQIYLQHCAGISSDGIIALIKDAQRIRKECALMEDPSMILSTLISRALMGSL